jgi:hypothetical protein
MDIRTEDIATNDNTHVTSAELHNKNGRIAFETMAWASWERKHIEYTAEIIIHSMKHGRTNGYGKEIFRGTLEELIQKISPLSAEEPKQEVTVNKAGEE